MGRILIDTRDLRDAAQDLRRSTGVLDHSRSSIGAAFRGAWLGPGGERFHQEWAARDRYLAKGAGEVRTVAAGLDQYAVRVDQEQAQQTALGLRAPWSLRPLRRSMVLGFFAALTVLRRTFRTIEKLLAEMVKLLARGLLRVAGLLDGWQRALWKWITDLARSVLQIGGYGRLLVAANAAWWLFPLRGITNHFWRGIAALAPTVPHRGASDTWNSLARSGESALDRASRWLAAPPPQGFAPGEFGIIDRGNGQVLIVMRGLALESVSGNTPEDAGWEQMGFGPYSAQIEAELLRLKQKYPNLTVSFVGHSEGGMAARNVVAENLERIGIRVGAVVTIDSPVDGREIPPTVDQTNVFQFNNKNFLVSGLDGNVGNFGETKVNADGVSGDHSPDQFVGGANMTPEQRAEWERAGGLLQNFETILPGGSVQVYGR